MSLPFRHRVTLIARGALLRLEAVPGLRIGCVRGTLWVTLPGDPGDRVLGAGEALTFERSGLVLVNALGTDAALGVEYGIRLGYARRGAVGPRPERPSLGASIERIRPRYDVTTPAGAAIAQRRARIEAEARWMRGQVMALLLSHATDAIAAGYARLVRRLALSARPLSTAIPVARKKR